MTKKSQKMSETFNLPNIIKVAGFDIIMREYQLHRSVSDNNWGRFSANEMLIEIDMTRPSKLHILDTLIHEINHAVYWIYNIYDDDKEERIVSTFAKAWLQIYRDNPDLLRFINATCEYVDIQKR